MKIQRKPLAVLAGSATLVAGVALWPSAAGADPHHDRSDSKTLEVDFVGERLEEALIDNGATGISLGDEFVYTNRHESEDGAVSTVYGECTVHQVTAATVTWNCVSTSDEETGTITTQGLLQLDSATGAIVGDEGVWAVTGGTGDFERARGQVTFTSKGQGLDTVITGTARLHLR